MHEFFERKHMIPLCTPSLGKEENRAVAEVLKSGWLAHGSKVEEFERRFAEYIGVKEAVSLNSCTSALYLSLVASEIKGEVIIPSFTFVATANAVVTAGCIPVFADIDYDTLNIDPQKIEKKISPHTRTIIPVHFGGQSCDMAPILRIARKHHLSVIEDSAETVGGTYKGKKTGSFVTGCFSFFPTKNMTTGEGGMVTTNSKKLADRIRALAGHGIHSTSLTREKRALPWFRSAINPGYNFRMSNILAAVGVEQLKKIEQMNQSRRENAAYLNEHLNNVEEIDPPVENEKCIHVYQMYTIKVNNLNRNALVTKLRERGIGASVHFDPPVHLQYFYKGKYDDRDLEVTEKVAQSIITLPMFPQMKRSQLKEIVTKVRAVIREMK